MVVYEVNLSVEREVTEAFGKWLRRHIPEVIELPGFLDATWYYQESPDGPQLWTVHYRLVDLRALEEYFERHAERMRDEGMRLFSGQFTASRRVLIEREGFGRVGRGR